MQEKQTPPSTETMQAANDLLDAIRRQYSVRGAQVDGWVSPILRLDGLRTMLRLRFDQRMGNAKAQGELDDADEKTLCFYRNLFDEAAEEVGLSDADLRRIYTELDQAVL